MFIDTMARDLIVGTLCRMYRVGVRNSYWLEYKKVGRKSGFQSRIDFSSPQDTYPPTIESRAILCTDTLCLFRSQKARLVSTFGVVCEARA